MKWRDGVQRRVEGRYMKDRKHDLRAQRDGLRTSLNASVFVIAVVVIIVLGVYLFNFFPQSGGVSKQVEDWGQFGDYIGGVLNPFMAFGAFYWLTRSVSIQRQELEATRDEMRESNKSQSKLAEYQRDMVLLSALTAILRGVEFQLESATRTITLVQESLLTNPNPFLYRGEAFSHPSGKQDLVKLLHQQIVLLEADAEKYRSQVLGSQLLTELSITTLDAEAGVSKA